MGEDTEMRPITVELITERGGNALGDVANPVVVDVISGGGALVDTPEFFEDTSFEAGDSPATIDINGSSLGRNSTQGTVINDGTGDFTVAFSTDGSAFGDAIRITKNDTIKWNDISVDSLKIIHSGTDSAYRVIAI